MNWRALVYGLCGTLLFAGCYTVPAEEGPAKTAVKRSFTVPKVDTRVVEPGKIVATDHFVMRFEDGLETFRGYETVESRENLARGKLLQMEAQYAFLKDALDMTIHEPVGVIVVPGEQAVLGRTAEAHASARTVRMADGSTVLQSQVVFTPSALADNGTLAHELTHALQYNCIGIRAPAWFAEGLAMMVQTEFAGYGVTTPRATVLGPDDEGFNLIQQWRAHGTEQQPWPPDLERDGYRHGYHIVLTLRNRYGDPFYHRLFKLLSPKTDGDWGDEMNDSRFVAVMSAAAGESLVPYFRDVLRFHLTDAETRTNAPDVGDIPSLR
ncbi:MAG: hypothetical protein O3A46_17425 [Candidatus Poribacteria bacterium]|nr:hypothetical protein [Candidatus Poribacteria bacterium]